MKPYAELLEFNQPNPIRKPGFTRIRDQFPGLRHETATNEAANTEFGGHWGRGYLDPERIIEFAGRWDYGENNARKLGEKVKVPSGSTIDHQQIYDEVPIIQKYLAMGHESMIEMGEATFFIECSRIVSLELARHRHQERQEMSQRFVKFDNASAEELFIRPPGLTDGEWNAMLGLYVESFHKYIEFRDINMSPQDARYVLPGGFVTKMIVKMNVREWRHVLKLRLDKSAQPEMRELMQQVYDQLVDIFPNALHGVQGGPRGTR